MLSRQKITLINSLNRKKNRVESGLYLIEGFKLISMAVQYCPDDLEAIFASQTYYREFENTSCDLVQVDERDLKKISNQKTPQGAAALVRIKDNAINPELGRNGLNIFLDGVQDPGNVGTLIRTADWFGTAHLILGHGCADLYSPKVIQSAMGSHFKTNIVQLPIEQTLKILNPALVIGAEAGGQSSHGLEWSGALLCLGNEGSGLSEEVRSKCSAFVGINGHPERIAESLNVSMVGAILMDRFFNADKALLVNQ